ncbi:MAG: mechanosensitive ion channel domain-containing protein [Bryobacteraceae bacterium]
MRRLVFCLALCLVLCLIALRAPAQTLNPQDVLQHLNQTIGWYRHVNSVDQSPTAPENLLLQDNVRESSKRVVQLAFTFARAEANALAKNSNPGANTSAAPSASRSLEQAVAQANDRISKLESEIETITQQIDKSAGRKRAILTSQRDTLSADLNLAKEFQAAVKNVVSFERGPNTPKGGSGLLAQINDLANSDSIPGVLNSAQKTNAPGAQALASQAFHPESAGIVTLVTKAVSLANARAEIDSLIAETAALLAEMDKLKLPFRSLLRASISQGDAIANASIAQTDPAQLDAARKQLDTLADRFKQAADVMTPLSEQGIVLQSSRSGLADWRSAIDRQYSSTLRYLGIRLGVLLVAIVFVLVLSEVWRRTIFRYVREPRRRRQFMLVRRFVITFGIVLVVALGFFTSISSVATFVGFITAGLALALQNVILSVVAYFFLIGRYGLRVGDRVTVSGVTGQVIDIGLVRFSVMEFAGAGVDIHSSGRVAVFANSIIFQAYALLKQAPGTEYIWHAVSTTLVPEVEHKSARERLTSGVESVYNDYKGIIESQHAAFEQSINMQMPAPKPVSRVLFTNAGYEIFIRYPAEIEHVSDIDERIVKRLIEETEREPQLKLAPGGAPRTVPAT